MAVIDQSGIVGKTRDKPIGQKLIRVLEAAADAAGIDTVFVTSGSQPGTHGRSTGSTRHNNGRAADLQLIKDGVTLSFSDRDGGPVVEAFVTAAAANGANGIGAGVGYMGPMTLHIGFGTTAQDHTKLVWGARGRSANAPAWLRQSAQRGWNNPADFAGSAVAGGSVGGVGRFVVIARGGLQLRKGPGLDYGITRTLETGTGMFVAGYDGANDAWARVDLEGDGLLDGHVFAAFLAPAEDQEAGGEDVEEPGVGES